MLGTMSTTVRRPTRMTAAHWPRAGGLLLPAALAAVLLGACGGGGGGGGSGGGNDSGGTPPPAGSTPTVPVPPGPTPIIVNGGDLAAALMSAPAGALVAVGAGSYPALV